MNRLLTTTVALLTLMAVSSCAENAEGGTSATVALPSVLPTAPPVTLPTSPEAAIVQILTNELTIIDFAELKVRDQCMIDAGYPQFSAAKLNAPPWQLTFENNALSNLVQSMFSLPGPMTQAETRADSFGLSTSYQPAQIVSSDPTYTTQLDACQARAYDTTGVPFSVIDNYYTIVNEMFSDFYSEFRKTIGVYDQQLRGCIEQSGYTWRGTGFTLPELYGIVDERTDGPEASWSPDPTVVVNVGPEVAAVTHVPSEAEVAFASTYVSCLDTTGVGASMRVDMPAHALEAITKHLPDLVKLNPTVVTGAISARSILAE